MDGNENHMTKAENIESDLENREIQNECPLVTFALFAYNQENYIKDAIKGALAQCYQRLEIIISDDCSTDKTYKIICDEVARYQGPHCVRARRNKVNFGVMSHVLEVAQEARGVYFVVAAGDDIAVPWRTERIISAFAGTDALALSSDDIIIDEHGNEKEWDEKRHKMRDNWHASRPSWIHGASAAYVTDFLKKLPIPNEKILFEDMVFADLISLLRKRSIRLKEPLIKYRYHFSNLSNRRVEKLSVIDQEGQAVQRWIRAHDAKRYSLESIRLLEVDYDTKVYQELSSETTYLALISNWQTNRFYEKIKLLWLSIYHAGFRSSLLRVFGISFFYWISRRRMNRSV